MTVRFEGIVRPFQTRDLSPPKIEPITPTVQAVKTVKFEWGKGKSGTSNSSVQQWNYSQSVTNYMTKQQREQPTDPSNK